MANHCYQPGLDIYLVEGRDRPGAFHQPVREYRSLDSARVRLRDFGISASDVDKAISTVSMGLHTKIDYVEPGGEVGCLINLFPSHWTNDPKRHAPPVELKAGDHSKQ